MDGQGGNELLSTARAAGFILLCYTACFEQALLKLDDPKDQKIIIEGVTETGETFGPPTGLNG